MIKCPIDFSQSVRFCYLSFVVSSITTNLYEQVTPRKNHPYDLLDCIYSLLCMYKGDLNFIDPISSSLICNNNNDNNPYAGSCHHGMARTLLLY